MTTGVKTAQTFVCLDCGIQVIEPQQGKGFLRCAEGHRVQVVKSRALWQISLLAFIISIAIASVLIHLLQTVWTGSFSSILVWVLLAGLLAFGVYLVILGLRHKGRTPPIDVLSRQYIAIGIARICAAMALSALAALGITY
jgi:hypothetical protein